MGLRFAGCLAVLLAALSGCAAAGSKGTEEGVIGRSQPQAFDQILVARESAALSDVVSILVSKGYPVIWDSPKEIAAEYHLHPLQILVMICSYLGQSKTPAGKTTASVSCTAADLATGARL